MRNSLKRLKSSRRCILKALRLQNLRTKIKNVSSCLNYVRSVSTSLTLFARLLEERRILIALISHNYLRLLKMLVTLSYLNKSVSLLIMCLLKSFLFFSRDMSLVMKNVIEWSSTNYERLLTTKTCWRF